MPSHRPAIESPLAVEVELRKEKASALRRAGDKLDVHREAMGLWSHSEVELMYPVPPQVK